MNTSKAYLMIILSFLLSLSAFNTAIARNGGGNFSAYTGTMAPGLRDKGLPSGLANQDKTPPGWSHGRKVGWYKHHHHHHHLSDD